MEMDKDAEIDASEVGNTEGNKDLGDNFFISEET
jgi:hypothetical protein